MDTRTKIAWSRLAALLLLVGLLAALLPQSLALGAGVAGAAAAAYAPQQDTSATPGSAGPGLVTPRQPAASATLLPIANPGRAAATPGAPTPYSSYLPQVFQPNPRCPTIKGWKGEYWNNETLTGAPVLCRDDAGVSFDWGPAGPGAGVNNDHFSARWTRRMHLSAGSYTFIMRIDDGMRVWMDNELIFDNWRVQAVTEYRVSRNVAAGDHDFRIEYLEVTGDAVAQFHWQVRDTRAGIVISNKQALDTCGPASADDMQIWWNQSPYWETNLYIGGVLRGCNAANQARLTPDYLNALHRQGWNFIPTWVGPQAPCSDYPARISADSNEANSQGRSEADAAVAVANSMGLTTLAGANSSTVIYYDMEWFKGDDACHKAVQSFFSGWTARLHELGMRSGAYAVACAISEMANIPNAPDDVWAASWDSDTYNKDASAFGVYCLDDSVWANHQRIHQYAGGHNETWGNLTINIDSNIVDGHVAGANERTWALAAGAAGAAGEAAAAGGATSGEASRAQAAAGGAQVQAMQLLPSGTGWAQTGDRLQWTADAGGQWRDVTPQVAGFPAIQTAGFLDADHGWALLSGANARGGKDYVVARTADSGRSWQSFSLPAPAAAPAGLAFTAAGFDFINSQTGWLAVTLPSSSSFSRGALFATTDGGQTWTEHWLPIGAPVRFIDRQSGWVAGGANRDELFVTRDGGNTWVQLQVANNLTTDEHAYYDLPAFQNASSGQLPVTVDSPTRPRVDIYVTDDAGKTWRLGGSSPLPAGSRVRAPVPVASLAGATWLAADPSTGRLVAPGGATRSSPSTAAALRGVTDLQFAGGTRGWALVQDNACTGSKAAGPSFSCTSHSALLATADGGATWAPLNP